MVVNKKYLKIGVAGLAVCALIIGLSVILTQKSKNNSAEMVASAAIDCSSVYSDFEEDCSSSLGKSGNSGVLGTEDYEKVEINSGKRRHLKADMDMMVSNSTTYFLTSTGLSDILEKSDESCNCNSSSGKSDRSGGSSGESDKSGRSKSSCRAKIKDTCDISSLGKSGKSGGDKNGNSGGKSGKSGGDKSSGSGKSGKSGGSDNDNNAPSPLWCSCSSSKSGKSGGGKSGKSGEGSSSGSSSSSSSSSGSKSV